ncbi:MAG: NAD(+)/NADH kinase [Tissierellia bacterium]|jgi:NAD+ kinase|nr:NAD(+)/NADH kinase [Tissierellia bacterium]
MKRVFVYNNRRKESLNVKNQVMSLLRRHQFELTKKNPEVILVIGGDGTMLSAIRSLGEMQIPFLGVNTGSLGFLPGLLPHEIDQLPALLGNDKFYVDSFPLLEVVSHTVRGKEVVNYAFNEMIIKHYNPRLMEAHIYINKRPFNYFTGDGLIVSTPIGTTGYAIWAGGAAIHSELDVFQITPLQPNDNRINRPLKNSLVLPANSEIQIKVILAHRRSAMVACDGVVVSEDHIQDVTIRLADRRVKILRAGKSNYFDLYRNKIIDKNIFRYLKEAEKETEDENTLDQ